MEVNLKFPLTGQTSHKAKAFHLQSNFCGTLVPLQNFTRLTCNVRPCRSTIVSCKEEQESEVLKEENNVRKENWSSNLSLNAFQSKEALKTRRRGGRKGIKAPPKKPDVTDFQWASKARFLALQQTRAGLYGRPFPNFNKVDKLKRKQELKHREKQREKSKLAKEKYDDWALSEEDKELLGPLVAQTTPSSVSGELNLSEEYKERIRSQVRTLSDASGFRNGLQDLVLLQEREDGKWEFASEDELDLDDEDDEDDDDFEDEDDDDGLDLARIRAAFGKNKDKLLDKDEDEDQDEDDLEVPEVKEIKGTFKVQEIEDEEDDEERRSRRPIGKRHLVVKRGVDPLAFSRKFQEASTLEEAVELVACEMDVEGLGGHKISAFDSLTAVRRLAELALWGDEGNSVGTTTATLAGRQEVVKLVNCAAKRAVEPRGGLSVRGLAEMVWGICTLGGTERYAEEIEAVAEKLGSTLMEAESEGDGQETVKKDKKSKIGAGQLAKTVASLARARIGAPPGLISAMSARAADLIGRFSGKDTSGFLWGCATLAETPFDFLDQLDQRLEEEDSWLDSWTDQQLASSAWSLAVLAAYDRPIFGAIWEEIMDRAGEGQLDQWGDRQLAQVYQAGLSYQLESRFDESSLELKLLEEGTGFDEPNSGEEDEEEGFRFNEPGQYWDEGLYRSAREAWTGLSQRMSSRQLASGLEGKLAYHLATVGPGEWSPQVQAAEYSLDFGLPEKKIGLEVDGPSHFTRNTSEIIFLLILSLIFTFFSKISWIIAEFGVFWVQENLWEPHC